MKLSCAIYLAAFAAAVTAVEKPQKFFSSGQPTTSQLLSNHTIPAADLHVLDIASGRIEVHWKFSPDEGYTGGLWVQYYQGANPTPVCDEFTDISPNVASGTLNGNLMYSCGITVDFDGPGNVISETPVATYVSGQGVNCGWVLSPGHTGFDGFLRRVDYYYHCYW